MKLPLWAISPRELVDQSVANYLRDYRVAAMHYTFLQRDTAKSGSNTKVSIARVTIVNGLPYEQTIARDGHDLTPDQKAKEQSKLDKRRKESAADQQKRLREYDQSPAFLKEVPDAFQFQLLDDETVAGRPNYVVECKPKPGYKPHSSRAAMFQHIEAKLWIDKQDVQWTKADAKVLDTISIGWILARIAPGAEIRIEQTRLNDQDWLPSLIDINGDAKVLLVKDHPIHEQIVSYGFQPIASNVTRK